MAVQSLKRIEPTTAPRADSPIDLMHLSNQTLGDPALELEVLRLFDEMSRVYYGRLEQSTTVPDLLRNLHTLRGAASGIGAFGLAELARVAEAELRQGSPVNPERIEELRVAVDAISAFIARRISSVAAA